jgi:hypothetical protein
MMRFLFLGVYFFAQISFAQYEQLVAPTRIRQMVDKAQYTLNQTLNRFFKTATLTEMTSPSTLNLQAQIFCANFQVNTGLSELFVEHAPIQKTAEGLLVHEALYLKACNRRVEIFMVERIGEGISLSSDADLLRGVFPSNQHLKSYRLYLVDQKIKFEISTTESEQKLNFNLSFNNGNSQIQMQIFESPADKPLTQQLLSLSYRSGARGFDDGSEYVWNLDPRNGVPRQYLYHLQKEISPGEFLKIQDPVFSQAIFPLIEDVLQFDQNPL